MHNVKIRHKIMLLFTALVTTIILLLAYSVYYFSSVERKIVFYKRLKSRANYSTQLYSLFGDSSNTILGRVDSTSLTGLLPHRIIAIYPLMGRIIYQFDGGDSQHIIIPDEILKQAVSKGEVYFKLGNRDAIAIQHKGNGKDFVVIVAAYDEDGIQRLDELVRVLVISLLVAVLITGWAGYLFSKSLLKPISQIIHEVNEISSYNLSRRIRTENNRDELSQLAGTFNELLERLQKSFDIQRRFISNASHELSTPLTSILSQLEVTLHKTRGLNEYQKVLASIREDVLQMRQLTKSLLEIAKADVQGNIELTEVRVDEILLRVTSEVEKINEDYAVELFFGEFPNDEKDCVVFGNVELLHSAIKNIVENGCKYSTDKVSHIDLSFSNHHIYISVMNKGNVIATEEIQRIFQPFYRGTNAGDYKGFGLGLALAKGIASLHKGSIEVKSDPVLGGTMFIITIPSYKNIQLGN